MYEVKSESVIAQSCPILCHLMDYSTPGSSIPGIIQARILEWVAILFSRGIFPTQGLNPHLPHCRQILYLLSHLKSSMYVYTHTHITESLCCTFLTILWHKNMFKKNLNTQINKNKAPTVIHPSHAFQSSLPTIQLIVSSGVNFLVSFSRKCFLYILAVSHGMWDLHSLTRNWTGAPCTSSEESLTTRSPGKSS